MMMIGPNSPARQKEGAWGSRRKRKKKGRKDSERGRKRKKKGRKDNERGRKRKKIGQQKGERGGGGRGGISKKFQ